MDCSSYLDARNAVSGQQMDDAAFIECATARSRKITIIAGIICAIIALVLIIVGAVVLDGDAQYATIAVGIAFIFPVLACIFGAVTARKNAKFVVDSETKQYNIFKERYPSHSWDDFYRIRKKNIAIPGSGSNAMINKMLKSQ